MKNLWIKTLLIITIISFLFVNCVKNNKKVKLELVYSGPGLPEEIKVMKEAFKMFEDENPGVKVKFIHSSWNEYWSKLETMLAGGTPLDVVYMGGGWLQALAKKKSLINLEDFIKKDKDINIKDFFPEALKAYTYKNNLYGIPRDVGPFVLFYNKDIFDACNVPYPDKSWDWNKLIKYGKMLTKDLNGDGKIDQYAYDMAGGYEEYMRIIWSFGGKILNKDRTKLLMNSKGAKKGLKILRDLIDKYKISPKLTKRSGINFFETGRIAIHPDGYWMMAHYKKSLKFRWGVAPLIKGDKRVGFLSETSYAIPATTIHKEMAWKLLKFLVSEKVEKLYAMRGLAIPARRSVAYSSEVKNLPYMDTFLEAVEYSKSPPFVPEWNEMIDILRFEMEKYFLGRYTVDQLIKVCQNRVNNLLNKMNNNL